MKILKKTFSLIAVLAMLLSLTACGEEPDASVNNIRARGVLKVAIPNTESSMFYYDEEAQDFRGLEAEMIDVLAAAIGVEKEYVPVDAELLYSQVLTGVCDVAIGMKTAAEITQNSLAASTSYGSEKLYIVTPRGVYAGDKNVFSGKGLGVSSRLASDGYSDYLYILNVNMMKYNNSDNVIGALNTGAITGYLCFKSEAEYILSQGDYQLQVAPGLTGEQFAIAILPTSTNLISGTNFTVNEFLTGAKCASWITENTEEVPAEE